MKQAVITEVWAHRGASAYQPENSIQAFELAIALGADGIELDVHLSEDGKLVVTHDENVKRLTGVDRLIATMTYNEIQKLNFAETIGITERVRAPLLEDVLDLLKYLSLKLNIELKNDRCAYDQLEERALAAVRQVNMEDRVIFSSFNHRSMQKMRALNTTARTGLLFAKPIWKPWELAIRLRAQAIHPFYWNLLIPGYVKNASHAGIEINTWTVNTVKDIRFALRKGCRAVITNYPDVAISEREAIQLNQMEG